jgi:pimeloyl-ACP methyl ester carboxylesterase/class 3 adenylate cyclase
MQYRFGDYVLDTRALELRSRDSVIELEPQVFSVLTYLVEHHDRVVPKDELLDNVWGDRFVSDSALATRIKQARQAVGDSGQAQQVIKTLHGRGYRFVAALTADYERPGDVGPVAPTAIPPTRYAEAEGASIAYQTFGEGPDLVLIAGFATNVEVQWEHPAIAAFLRRMATFVRVTVLDKRGVGLSDRMPRDHPPSLETRADDLRAVMDAAGIERATIFGSSEGGSLAITFAASHPERVDRLVLHGTWVRHPSHPGRDPRDLDAIDRQWGTGSVIAPLGPALDATPPGRSFLARYERQSATPRTARLLRELTAAIDVSCVLPAISVPTLVLHRRDDSRIPFTHGQELAAGIPNAQLVALDGSDHYLFSGDVTPLLDAIAGFVAGAPQTAHFDDQVLATVLFVDIVDSTPTARQMGDERWTALLSEFHAVVQRVLAEWRGALVSTAGDGVLATFDGPGRAVRAAAAIRDAVAPLGVLVRSGLHTAEIQRRGDDIAGIGVHVASRVAATADPGEVWVSRTVTDLVAGTGLTFTARGAHTLKGFEQAYELYSADI